MESRQKLFQRIRQNPKHVSYDDLALLLRQYGFEENNGNGGSHRTLIRGTHRITIPYRRPYVLDVYVKQALRLCEAHDLSPRHAATLPVLDSAYPSRADSEAREASLRRALEQEPDNPEALHEFWVFLVGRGRQAEGIAYLQRCRQGNPDSLNAVKAHCNALRQTGRSCEAEHIFADARQRLRAENVGIEYGSFLIELGELAKAEAVLRDVAKRFPTARARTEWATSLSLCDRHVEAARVLQDVTRSQPGNHRAWCKLAFTYDRLGSWTKALAAAKHAVQLKEDDYRNWHAMATVLLSWERYHEAVRAACRGRELMAHDGAKAAAELCDMYYIEAVGLAELDQRDQELQRLEEMCRDFPDQVDPVADQAELLYNLKRYDEAVKVARRGCKLMRRDGSKANWALLDPFDIGIRALAELDLRHELLEFIRVNLEVEPELRKRRLFVSWDLGKDLYGHGRVSIAQDIFQQLHQLAPDHARVLSGLASPGLG